MTDFEDETVARLGADGWLVRAGSLVPNLSCVVRELVENALDAGATAVSVQLAEDSVTCTDNGRGIELDALLDGEIGCAPVSSKQPRGGRAGGGGGAAASSSRLFGMRGEALCSIGHVGARDGTRLALDDIDDARGLLYS